MALPPVCAGGVFHYMLLISLVVLQTALNVSCSGHRDSVSIIRVEAATVNQELIASVLEGRDGGRPQLDRAAASRRTQVHEQRQIASH